MKLQLSLLLFVGSAPLCVAHAQDVAPDTAPETESVAPAVAPYNQALDNAAALVKNGKWDAARLELNGALKLAQTPAEKADIYEKIGAIYEAQGSHAQAQVQFRQAMSVPNVSAAQKMSAHLALAASLRDAKNYVAAGKETDAIFADATYDLGLSDTMVALGIRGDAQLQAKDWEGARASFDELVQLPLNDDDLTPAAVYAPAIKQLNRANALLEANQPAPAREQFRALQKTLPTLPQGAAMTSFFGWLAQQSIAQSYLNGKDNGNARVELEKLLAMPQLPADIAAQTQEDLAALQAPATGK